MGDLCQVTRRSRPLAANAAKRKSGSTALPAALRLASGGGYKDKVYTVCD